MSVTTLRLDVEVRCDGKTTSVWKEGRKLGEWPYHAGYTCKLRRRADDDGNAATSIGGCSD